MGEIVLGPWRRNANSPSIIFPPGVDKKEHLNGLIYAPPGGKPDMHVLYIRAIVDPDCSILDEDSEEEIEHRIRVATVR